MYGKVMKFFDGCSGNFFTVSPAFSLPGEARGEVFDWKTFT